MTAIFTNSANSLFSDNVIREYQIEVITFDRDSETVYVEAHDELEAQEIAASMVDNADYCMVQGCFPLMQY